MEFTGKATDKQCVGIYAITNLKTGVKYIGQTQNAFWKRYKEHLTTLRNGKHENALLQQAWDCDGAENFVFSIVRKIRPMSSTQVFYFWEYKSIIEAKRSCGVYNLQLPSRSTKTFSFSDFFGDRVVGRYMAGQSAIDIAFALDIPFGEVLKIINKFNSSED